MPIIRREMSRNHDDTKHAPGHDHDSGHDHDHGHDHAGHSHGGLGQAHGLSRAGESKRLWLVLFIALAAVIAEGLGGFFSGSLALLSDAGHLLADTGAIALALFALRVGTRPADAKRTYGYYRLEILAALINGAALVVIAIFIAIEAMERFRNPQPVQVSIVVEMATLGIVLNAAGMWLTHSGEHDSMNMRGTFLHLAGDLVNSVGVLISAAIIHFTGWQQSDPIISFVIAGTIVWSAIRLCREAVDVLLEGFPRHLQFADVSTALGGLSGVTAVHDLHVWTITSGMVAMSCHLVVDCVGPSCRSHDEILTEAREALKRKFNIEHTTIQFESATYRHEELVH